MNVFIHEYRDYQLNRDLKSRNELDYIILKREETSRNFTPKNEA